MALGPNFLSLVLNVRKKYNTAYTRIIKYNGDGVLHLAPSVFELCPLSSIQKYKNYTQHFREKHLHPQVTGYGNIKLSWALYIGPVVENSFTCQA
jgi:hypothetical protein